MPKRADQLLWLGPASSTVRISTGLRINLPDAGHVASEAVPGLRAEVIGRRPAPTSGR